MVWSVWYGMVWYGMVWYGMICGMVLVWYGIVSVNIKTYKLKQSRQQVCLFYFKDHRHVLIEY